VPASSIRKPEPAGFALLQHAVSPVHPDPWPCDHELVVVLLQLAISIGCPPAPDTVEFRAWTWSVRHFGRDQSGERELGNDLAVPGWRAEVLTEFCRILQKAGAGAANLAFAA
jgi:hypothetical protein